MDEDILEEYLDRPVRIHFAPGMIGAGLAPCLDGKLYDFGPSGILLEEADGSLDYIPLSAIRLVQIRPKPGLWARLTGSA
ncbi:hypothetical protein ACFSO0_14940 [Brevibacillus sp. GCM10020057]|uniref:hypothetical protein n=1 Tax=Brevibacillus sp. GCM10020057 TaxID=3317327 RepID=UPI00362B37B5